MPVCNLSLLFLFIILSILYHCQRNLYHLTISPLINSIETEAKINEGASMAFRYTFDLRTDDTDNLTVAIQHTSLRYTFDFRRDETDNLSVEFLDKDTPTNKACGVAALHVLLLHMVKLKDYDFSIKHEKAEIIIHKKTNIILFLDFILRDEMRMSFNFPFYSLSDNHVQRWKDKLTEMLVSCIGNNNLSIADFNKLLPVMRTYLDIQYNILLQEPLVAQLAKKAENNYGTNPINHPFYQTLSILMESYESSIVAHNRKGFLNKIGTKPEKNPTSTFLI